jgi:hypothetical protein
MQASKALALVVAGVAMAMAACAGPVHGPGPDRSLTSAEVARLEALKEATERVRLAYGAGCLAKPCIPRFAISEELEAPAMWDGPSFRVWLQRRALAPGAEPRPALAHELSHWLLGHTQLWCRASLFDCETAANAESVHVLVVGWGLTHDQAVSLVYAALLGGLKRNVAVRGHERPCEEVAAFARAFNRPEPPCAER